MTDSMERGEERQSVRRVVSALFYGLSSCLMMVLTKSVLTSYQFPSFQVLAIGICGARERVSDLSCRADVGHNNTSLLLQTGPPCPVP